MTTPRIVSTLTLGVAILGVIVLSGCTTSAPPHKAVHTGAVIAPSAPASDAPDASTETMPTSLRPAANATFPEFLNLPLADRLTYCSWETRDMSAVAANWESNTKDKNDLLTTITSKSTPQELFNRAIYNIRAAFISHENGLELPDLATAQKILSCAYTNVDSTQATIMFNTLSQSYKDGQTGYAGGFYAQHGKFVAGSVTSEGTSVVDGNPTVNVNVDYSDGAGTGTATLTTIEGVDYRGRPMTYVTVDFQ